MSSRLGYAIRSRFARLSLLGYIFLFFVFLLGPIVIVVAISFSTTEYVVFPPKGFSLLWY